MTKLIAAILTAGALAVSVTTAQAEWAPIHEDNLRGNWSQANSNVDFSFRKGFWLMRAYR